MILVRVLAVLSAASLVGAFALATVLTPYESLAELLADWDHPWLVWLNDFSVRHLPDWLWHDVMIPVLMRPAWLLPTAFGLLLLGGAVTANSRKSVTRSHRRRS